MADTRVFVEVDAIDTTRIKEPRNILRVVASAFKPVHEHDGITCLIDDCKKA